MTNRALVLAALSGQKATISHPLISRDSQLMSDGLRAMGIEIAEGPTSWVVTPLPLRGPARIDVGNAGTVMRFLPAVAALADGAISFDGDPRSHERPVKPVLDALRQLGVQIDDQGRGALPITVLGTGELRGGHVEIDASSSSQFISALLLIGAATKEGISIRHTGSSLPSMPHIDMTIEMLNTAGVAVKRPSEFEWSIAPQSIDVRSITIEPDLSNAAPFMAAAMVCGGEVIIEDWPRHTTQAGDQLREIFANMGAEISFTPAGLSIKGGALRGITRNLNEVGELTPVIAALCALADSPSELSGIAHLRLHETDRLEALAREINGLGGRVEATADGLSITPAPLHAGTFHTYEDHRLATAGAVLGLAVDGITVENIETTKKTLPDFVGLWSQLG